MSHISIIYVLIISGVIEDYESFRILESMYDMNHMIVLIYYRERRMEWWMVIVESSFSFPNSTLFALFLLFAVHIDAALHTNDTRRCWLIGQRLFRPRPPSTVHPRLSLPASRVPSSKHSATNQFSTLLPVMVQVDGQIIDGNGPMAPLATSHS